MTCYEQMYNEQESPTDETQQEPEGPLKTPIPHLGPITSTINSQGIGSQSSPKAPRAAHVKAYLPDEQVTTASFTESLNPFTPTDLYGMFQIKEMTIPF